MFKRQRAVSCQSCCASDLCQEHTVPSALQAARRKLSAVVALSSTAPVPSKRLTSTVCCIRAALSPKLLRCSSALMGSAVQALSHDAMLKATTLDGHVHAQDCLRTVALAVTLSLTRLVLRRTIRKLQLQTDRP